MADFVPHRCNSKTSIFEHIAVVKPQVVAVDNLWLCVAITLGMALVIGFAQPFAQPQMNVLQSACFGCTWPSIGGSFSRDCFLDPGP